MGFGRLHRGRLIGGRLIGGRGRLLLGRIGSVKDGVEDLGDDEVGHDHNRQNVPTPKRLVVGRGVHTVKLGRGCRAPTDYTLSTTEYH